MCDNAVVVQNKPGPLPSLQGISGKSFTRIAGAIKPNTSRVHSQAHIQLERRPPFSSTHKGFVYAPGLHSTSFRIECTTPGAYRNGTTSQGSHSDWKTWEMGRHFPVREKSGNFEQTEKVRENHTEYWKTQGISAKYYLCLSDI